MEVLLIIVILISGLIYFQKSLSVVSNGFNNWFEQQLLVSKDKSLRIFEFQRRNFNNKEILTPILLNCLKKITI